MTFKVIDGGGGGRDLRFAESEFRYALTEMTANLLRIVRGAGKPYELLRQMSRVINAAVKIQELSGALPVELVAETARMEDQIENWFRRRDRGDVPQSTIDRWMSDGTFEKMEAEDTIKRGVLQIIASEMLEQNTQRAAGKSEMSDGVRDLERQREKSRRYWAEQNKRATPKRKTKSKRTAKPKKDGPIDL